jgi:predicted transcriptional regulator
MAPKSQADLLVLTAGIVVAHGANKAVEAAELPVLIEVVYSSLLRCGRSGAWLHPKKVPAVPISASVMPDHLVCLEDGTSVKMLKPHLMSHHGMMAAEYRARWGLPADYPMMAPLEAARRLGAMNATRRRR